MVDQSRRTIVGTGKVLVARKPFKVYAWVDRGYYRTGDIVKAGYNINMNRPITTVGPVPPASESKYRKSPG